MLRHNVLFDRWVACSDVMAIMDWMHMAWNRSIPQACITWRSRLYCTYTDVLVLKPMYVCSLGRGAIAWFSCFEWCSTGGNPISISI